MKNKFKKLLYMAFTVIIVIAAVSGCKKIIEPGPNSITNPFNSFRDIPGVTNEEIRATEAILGQTLRGRGHFVYSVLPSTEAFYDDNGQIRGFSALFCEWLSGLFGIPFKPEFVAWDEYLATLASYEVDFSGAMTATEERRKTYFMTSAIATQTIRYYQLADSVPIATIAGSRPLRYAFIESTSTINEVTSTLESGTYEVILVKNTDEAYNLLKSGEADAFFNSNMAEAAFDIYGDVIAKDFLPLLFSPVSLTTQNPALEPFISVVQKALDHGAIRYLTMLYSKGYEEYLQHKLALVLTDEEKEYIKNHDKIKFVAEYYNYPISFYNMHEKEWQGIAFDLLSEVGRLAGMSFILGNDRHTEWPELLRMVEEGEAPLSAELVRSKDREGRFLWPKKASLTDNYVLISKSEYPNLSIGEIMNARIGLVWGSVFAEVFNLWFPDHPHTVEYMGSNAAFDALSRGEVDMVMSCGHRLLSITHFNELVGYKANIAFNHPSNSYFGLNKNETVLCSILDKALLLIDTEGISNQWMQKTFDYRVKLYVARLPWLISAVAFALIIVFLFFIFIRNTRSKRLLEQTVKNRTGELENQRDKTEALAHWYRSILDATPLPISVTDTEMNWTFVNTAVEDFLGRKRDDMYGKPCRTLNSNICNTEDCGIACAKRGSKYTVFTHGESSYKVDVEKLKKKDGDTAGFIEVFQDITQIEEMAKKQANAEAASSAKSAFIANMSHEIRTPMNSIIGFSELAQDGNIPLKTKEYLNKISENAKWLLHIINDILDISKIESGRMELEHIPFTLHEIFSQCQALIKPKAEEKGLTLYCYAEPSIGKTLMGDPVRLRQVLINLLTNAIKFTNIGTIKFLASVVSLNENNTTINFEVKDSGIGMIPEQIERIFTPFMQADETITRRYGGTGLGLAIAKNIIEMMGGAFEVESAPGVGSKFSFRLSFEVIDEPDYKPVQKIVLDESGKPNFEGEILICEDNEMNQQVISEHLERVGLRSIVANNGKEGVDIVKNRMLNGEKPFDLIFMDIHMPVMDGLEAASKITALKTETPIVAMTANIMTNDINLYKKSGIPDCVNKPFTSHELWECLSKYFQPVGTSPIDKRNQIEKDKTLQKKISISFAKNNQTTYAMIKKAIEAGELKLAHRLAHTLKANAGQIGKEQLRKAAEAIETALEGGKNTLTEAQMELLETELKTVLEELAPFLYENESEKKAPSMSRQEQIKLLEQLEGMLKKRNPECADMLDDIRTIAESGELAQQVEDLEFKKALDALYALKEKYNTD